MYKEYFFLIWRKNIVFLSRYLVFCVFDESLNFKVCDAIVDIAKHLCYKFIVSSEFDYQIEIWRDISGINDKYFQIDFTCVKTVISGPTMISIKWLHSVTC